MSRVLHPRFPPRRGAVRTSSWWGRAWMRAVEEAAYTEDDLRAGRTLARSGQVGQIAIEHEGVVAAVIERDDVRTVTVAVPRLDARDVAAFVETVAAEAGRIAALLGGDLPFTLVEHAEEAGVELLPYGGELESTCTCTAWTDPCAHALGVLTQLGWLVDADPFVLLALRGLDREALLARLHERGPATRDADAEAEVTVGAGGDSDAELEAGLDAALRAVRVLELLERSPDSAVDHLL